MDIAGCQERCRDGEKHSDAERTHSFRCCSILGGHLTLQGAHPFVSRFSGPSTVLGAGDGQ